MLSWERVLTSEYLNGSADQRMELLNGIIDAAGVVSSGKNPIFKVSVHSHKLALQIQQLVRSVGGWCKLYISEHRSHIYKGVCKAGRPIYGLSIKHPNMTRLVTDPDKRFKISENHYDDKMKLRIRNIEYIGEQETQCISIDHEDHLYITDDFIVTHNTFSSLMAAAAIGKATIVILNGLIDQWYDTIVTGRDGKPAQFIIDPKEVYIIQGQKSLVDLIENDKYNFYGVGSGWYTFTKVDTHRVKVTIEEGEIKLSSWNDSNFKQGENVFNRLHPVDREKVIKYLIGLKKFVLENVKNETLMGLIEKCFVCKELV